MKQTCLVKRVINLRKKNQVLPAVSLKEMERWRLIIIEFLIKTFFFSFFSLKTIPIQFTCLNIVLLSHSPRMIQQSLMNHLSQRIITIIIINRNQQKLQRLFVIVVVVIVRFYVSIIYFTITSTNKYMRGIVDFFMSIHTGF